MGATEILVVLSCAAVVGVGASYFLAKKKAVIDKVTKQGRKKAKILNDPERLKEELEKNGKIIDMGEDLEYSILGQGGNKVLVEKRTKRAKDPQIPAQAPKAE